MPRTLRVQRIECPIANGRTVTGLTIRLISVSCGLFTEEDDAMSERGKLPTDRMLVVRGSSKGLSDDDRSKHVAVVKVYKRAGSRLYLL